VNLWAVLLTGLFAGGASCAAVQGGLLAGTITRRQPAPVPAGARPKGSRKSATPPPPTRTEDVAPVGAFLVGKLASHVLLGAALGLLGDAVQISPRVRAYTQMFAGIVMLLLALDLLGVRAVRGIVPAPPKAWSRLVRRSGRLGGSLGPAVLGVSTVLIPCGVTLSVMFLAVASGSVVSGALIMGTFVVGTMPLFAVIGYAARRSTVGLRGRLGMLAGVAVLVAGLVAINAGLVLNGSSVTLAGAVRGVTGGDTATPVAAPPVAADGVQRIAIEVYDTAYSPSLVTAKAGVPTELTLRTDGTQGCTRSIVMSSLNIEEVLPETGETAIDLGTLEPGTYRYTCGMGMYGGSIKVVA